LELTLLALIAAGGLAGFLLRSMGADLDMKKVGEMPERNTVLMLTGRFTVASPVRTV
jgi:hypothetical protein